ncbi:hypothetical protein BDK51DRAFT_34147 [Blyttiomyces helicus]|uniref:DUF4246 domain-containing protein n=1 Tax=Blyttiomyces helicus TaxID=388810 RepID=A0A4P9WL33_9FUNG|nr:hypothetical protein BDK51DRAFT_34147 [Blyttiomyces helicus]|eukprot:RKO92298.1 hypothetical protein BDK51DRAFT_34147 [Blyttiomyces helicus]
MSDPKDAQGLLDSLKRAIRAKPDWKAKVREPPIARKYVEEAKMQDMPPHLAEITLADLLEKRFARLQNGEPGPAALDVRAIDGAVPAAVRDFLAWHLDSIAARNDRDFHPGSEGKVQDLIHPSLHPLALGVTPLVSGTLADKASDNVKYTWLPAEVQVDAYSKFASYINGLNPRTHDELYWCIERVFDIVLPMLEETVGRQLRERSLQRESTDWEEVLTSKENAFLQWWQEAMGRPSGNIGQNVFMGTVPTPAGRILTFTNTLQHKVAGVSRPASSDPNPGDTIAGDPNRDHPAMRKILCFLLVDPEGRITSTADVAEQQGETVGPEVYAVLDAAFRRSGIPTGCPIEVFEAVAGFAGLDRSLGRTRCG